MSEFRCPVVEIKGFGPHRNADTLSITQVEGNPVIFKTGDFQKGDLAVYIPVDAVVPATVPGTEFLDRYKRRVRAIRLRGVYSEGLLLPVRVLTRHPDFDGWDVSQLPGPIDKVLRDIAMEGAGLGMTGDMRASLVGQDVAPTLGITKAEDPIPPHMAGEAESPLSYAPVYDVESGRKYGGLFTPGEPVVVTEKIHGTNFRACYDSERGFMVGSRNMWWKENDRNLYWQVAKRYGLPEKLAMFPNQILYGEAFGNVQDMKYGAKGASDIWLRIFDIYNGFAKHWESWWLVQDAAKRLGLDTVPVLYQGVWDSTLPGQFVAGTSKLAAHFREGIVVKPLNPRYDESIGGRLIAKWISEEYRLRKDGTELH